jgi:type IV pilus modification protein PilV
MAVNRGAKANSPSCSKVGEQGFSLIEVMIAMVLLAVGMLAIGAAQLRSIEYGADSDNRSQAAYLAQQQLDAFLALQTNDINLTACQGPLGVAPAVADPAFPWGWCNDANANAAQPLVLANTATTANNPGVGKTVQFLRRWSIDQPGTIAGLPAGMYRITVQVRWNQTAADLPNSNARMVQLQGVK